MTSLAAIPNPFRISIVSDPWKSLEADVPGVYLAGVIASGNDANRLFIENARGHGELIVRDLLDRGRTRQA